ncbi:MAG: HAMP domain-containing histidine kinase, partial [Deltaproteobacteria bacterium]|nr:HAMP domain-containing histidine kinase [Deltaproteobacteria bacterium]
AVTDSGAGIPEADLGRIFEPFFSTKERKKGSGLGLAVCHRIIQEMGGSISVRSRPGAGSTFLVALPAVRGMAGREADGHA